VRAVCKQLEGSAAFAATQPFGTKRDRDDPLRLFRCGCGAPSLTRIRRAPWMRLLPSLRLYKCRACGVNVLRSRLKQGVYALHGYLPAFYRRSPPVQQIQRAPQVVQLVLESGLVRQLLMLGSTSRSGERQTNFAATRPM
jgi:hypothetical protein